MTIRQLVAIAGTGMVAFQGEVGGDDLAGPVPEPCVVCETPTSGGMNTERRGRFAVCRAHRDQALSAIFFARTGKVFQ